MRSPSRLLWVCALGALAGGIIVGAWLLRPPPLPELHAATMLPAPRPAAEFKLIDERGQAAGVDRLEGHWTLLFLGFTSCPDVCPTTLAVLSSLRRDLRAAVDDMQIVMLSADPQRDTPQVLAAYLAAFHPALIGLTGERAEIDKLCESLGLGYVRNPGAAGAYTVDHSAGLVLIDRRARAVAYFQPPFDRARLLADLQAVADSKG